MFSWWACTPALASDPVSQKLEVIMNLCEEAEICKHQAECLRKSFTEYLDSWRSRIGPIEDHKDMMERAIMLLSSCKKKGWVMRTLVRGESRQEFLEMHSDLVQSMQEMRVSGACEGMPEPSDFCEAADKDRNHLCELSCELQRMLQTVLQGFVVTHNDEGVLREQFWIRDESIMKPVKHLGKGNFGTVYEAIWNDNAVAVKVLHGGLPSSELRLASFKHPNIVSVIGHSFDERSEQYRIVMEKMDKDLRSVIDKRRKKKNPTGKPPFDRKLCISMMMQIAKGMCFLHANNVIHRDLKPENILVADLQASDWVVKIGDFGTSKTDFDTDQGNASPKRGTVGFRAPEVYGSQTYSRAADVFSYGMTCYSILTGQRPLEEVDPFMRDFEIREGRRPCLRDEPHGELKILLERCWHHEPNQRPCFTDICEDLHSIKKHYAA